MDLARARKLRASKTKQTFERDMNENGRPLIRKENTRRVEKLLFFKMPVRRPFQDGETGLLGHGDGHAAGKFRCVGGLHDLTLYWLAAGETGREWQIGGAGMMLESIAAKFARQQSGSIEVQRHDKRSFEMS